MSDDFADVVTAQYEPYIMVEWKINKIESTREDEFYVTLWVDHRFEPDRPVPMWEM